jgi:hypothetical protein
MSKQQKFRIFELAFQIFVIGLFAGWGGLIINSEGSTPEAKNTAHWILIMITSRLLFGNEVIKYFEQIKDFIKLNHDRS